MRKIISLSTIFLTTVLVSTGVFFSIGLSFHSPSNVQLLSAGVQKSRLFAFMETKPVIAHAPSAILAATAPDISNCVKTLPLTQINLANENSLWNVLYQAGVNPSFASRKTLAAKYGINNYAGTAEQNVRLLNIVKSKLLAQNCI
jgi:hypothetical protein